MDSLLVSRQSSLLGDGAGLKCEAFRLELLTNTSDWNKHAFIDKQSQNDEIETLGHFWISDKDNASC